MKHTRSQVVALLVLTFAAAGPAAAQGTTRKPVGAASCHPAEPAFWRDQGLTTKLATKLQFAKPLFREKVEVKVTGGAAMLSGNLSSQSAIDHAVMLARDTAGIRCVQNFLRVGPPAVSAPTAP